MCHSLVIGNTVYPLLILFYFSSHRLQVSLDKINNDGPVSLINYEDLKMENERLQGELDRTKKVYDEILFQRLNHGFRQSIGIRIGNKRVILND